MGRMSCIGRLHCWWNAGRQIPRDTTILCSVHRPSHLEWILAELSGAEGVQVEVEEVRKGPTVEDQDAEWVAEQAEWWAIVVRPAEAVGRGQTEAWAGIFFRETS